MSQEETINSTFFPSLLPLYGYYDRFKITMPSWPLPAFATLDQFPAELINKIQAFCSHDDLLSLTSVDKAAFSTRFCNLRLQKLCFKTEKDIAQFLSYCQASQDREAEELILEEGQKSRKRLKTAVSPDTITRFTLLAREHLQEVKTLTLTIYEQFTAEQYKLLFTYLPGIQHLTIYSEEGYYGALGVLLKAAQRLTLHHLTINSMLLLTSDEFIGDDEIVEDNLPDELWQLTTLETLTIRGFKNVASISEEIGQLKALKSFTLDSIPLIKALPASLWQLNKLEALTLQLLWIPILPEDIGQLMALKSLELSYLGVKKLPASLWRLNKLEALTLKGLDRISALPEDIGRLTELKSLTLEGMYSPKVLPASLWQLNKLEALTLSRLSITALPEDIGQLTELKSLKLKYLISLETLPASLGQLDKLEVLTLKYMPSITTLPEEIGQLNTLKIFKL
jgi:hypothetical protein